MPTATRKKRSQKPPTVAHVRRTVRRYIDGVMDGTIVAGKLVRLCVERHVRDLEDGEARGLIFDEHAAARVIRFFALLKHSKGEWAGQPFEPSPWQQFVLWCLFGWLRAADGMRRFRTAYCEVCRKAGKTTLAAGIGLYMLVADDEPGAEVYTAATKRDQARLAHGEAIRMVRSSASLRRVVETNKDALFIDATNSRYVPLGGDADSTDGLSPSCCIIDELHAHRSRAMFDVLDTATGSRRQPLIFCITTAGHDRNSICFEQHDYGVKVLERTIEDDTCFAFIAAIDENDDWQDESVWPKANPNLHVSLKIDDLRRKAQHAAEMPSALNAFLRLHLGVWTEAETRWLPMEKWRACGGSIDVAALEGRECWAGLDLASTQDLSALVLVFPPETNDEDDEPTIVLPFFWAPRENAQKRERRDRAPYLAWANEGYLELTDGEVTDYNFILSRVEELAQTYQVREIAFDRFGAASVVTALQEMGLEVVQFGQGYVSMSPPTKEIERLVVAGLLRHGDHPVLTWCASNVVVEMDPAGNIKPSRRKSTEKIDGVVALAMALGRVLAKPAKYTSVYETRGLLSI